VALDGVHDRRPDEDVAEPTDPGSAFNDLTKWRHHAARERSRAV
jgi:hypothetical protein